MNINELVDRAHENAVKHGFWDDYKMITDMLDDAIYDDNFVDKKLKPLYSNAISTRLMLIVGEVSEAMEALRKNDNDNFREELADIVIRVMDLSGGLGIDLEYEIIKKMGINAQRPYKHGKLF